VTYELGSVMLGYLIVDGQAIWCSKVVWVEFDGRCYVWNYRGD
jgi:hypothetical protein